MKLSRKSKIATIALEYLAEVGASKPVSLADIATRVKLSLSYMEQIFSLLNSAGLVESTKGPAGGYKITSLQTSVLDIVLAIEGELPILDVGGFPESKAWADLSQQTHEFWKSRTLADLII